MGKMRESGGCAKICEEIILLQDRQAALKLVRVEDSKFYRQPGSAKGMIRMSEDFDAPLEDFQEYMS